jgi:hypothetical protein
MRFFVDQEVRGRADANKDIVGLAVRLLEKVDIIRRDQAQVEVAGDFHQTRVHAPLGVETEVVSYDKVILRPENIPVGRRCRLGLLETPRGQKRGNLAFEASTEGQ